MKGAGCAGVATGSILVYAYILINYTKNRGFENEGFEVESFFRPPTTTFKGRQDKFAQGLRYRFGMRVWFYVDKGDRHF